ncbi:unnamed protein product [Orchesella dallaii]|uniref:Fibrinogen C-terminal domain-containing protein n=1 Tax=Orchesella dallaii TaxID=48710 RepID=A0ABP1QAY5_9HEXA
MDIDGGGWTIIQRRGFGSYGTSRQINFNRTWVEYVQGFGNASLDYWFGLENLRGLTKHCPYELLINMTNWEGENRYALYDRFYIGSSLDLYRLFVEAHSGTADSLLYHHKKQFSTFDRDNDDNWGEANTNCAETYGGGWWFGDCLRSNLNGVYFQNDGFLRKDKLNGIRWNSWTGMKESLKMTEMKIRPKCGFFSF